MYPSAWLRDYQRSWLTADTVAGLTLAAYAIPVSMGYATLAGVPPHCGIYCYLVGGIAYAALGTSRQLAIGPTSAIAMLVGSIVAGMAQGDPVRWVGIASLTAFVVSAIAVMAWALRLSSLMSFISETILLGFKAGAALTIALTQLPKLLGVPGGGDHFLERLWILLAQLPATNFTVLALGVGAILLLLAGDRYFPGQPVALVAVVSAILLVSLTELGESGLSVVGSLPRGLPSISLPSLRLRDVDGIIPLALACFLLSYIESVSAARTLAERNGYRVDSRQELLALGAANLAVSFAQGFPVSGGLSQSAVNDKAGARTPLALIVASLALSMCLMFLTDFLTNLPTVVLASIVLVAVKGLIDVPALLHLARVSPIEFRVALVAFAGVLLLGILKGVLLAAIVSLLMLVSAAAKPNVAFLGRIPGTERFSDLSRHPENESITGVLIFRVESSLLYFNADYVKDLVLEMLKTIDNPRLIVCDLSNAPMVDLAGARMLSSLQRELFEHQVLLRIVDAHARNRDLLRAEELEHQVGHLGRRITIAQVVEETLAT